MEPRDVRVQGFRGLGPKCAYKDLCCAQTAVLVTGDCVRLHGFFGRKWGFPKIRGTILGVPIIRTIVFWGLY